MGSKHVNNLRHLPFSKKMSFLCCLSSQQTDSPHYFPLLEAYLPVISWWKNESHINYNKRAPQFKIVMLRRASDLRLTCLIRHWIDHSKLSRLKLDVGQWRVGFNPIRLTTLSLANKNIIKKNYQKKTIKILSTRYQTKKKKKRRLSTFTCFNARSSEVKMTKSH